ncbi:hypothetical protein M433DRAFT_65847 [Acidomyces richmondensis BFW]|nr:MAG: hypothetical protein FE78DRAFT_146570 [Acidomyces sp. 'richmondensis']KYG46106.1 hypothetical protein M433DRAFT_65847 [Acidomyces richmondensis BFW]
MPLRVSPLQIEDIPAMAAVDAAAMATWGLARAMDQSATTGEPRQQMVERWMREAYGKDPTQTWMKVTDDEAGGELIAAALWKFQLQPEEERGAVGSGDATGREEKKQTGEEPAPPLATVVDGVKPFKSQFIGPRPHASLEILITHPAHQRRGAGTLLVQWGCARADELGIPCALTASAAGLRLYQREGFEVVMEKDMDLRPWGIEETEVRRAMVRPARGRSEA